ncbi:peptide deformylase [Candidatus Endowatersipora endosymbiont of Watersipora subatra]|uniref:peptide deformylase n=1 Tax=Candidatus Endowatersipora endosymbiont of Watersipora subatra TaxID=3077946 RepID=UPI00312C9D96
MSILPIVKLPDPILRVHSKPIERVDDDLGDFLDSMLETMYDATGIGLAAVQVGQPIRIFTVDCSQQSCEDQENNAHQEKQPIILINPEILHCTEEPSVHDEGCLSIPNYYAHVARPSRCTVKYLDRDGKEQRLNAEGILSTCIQHELDHLNGILFIDYLSKLKRDTVLKKFTKISKQNGTCFIG